MPKLTGIQVVETLRDIIVRINTRSRNVKVIEPTYVFITNYATPTFRKHMQALGVSECHQKPITPEQMLEFINKEESIDMRSNWLLQCSGNGSGGTESYEEVDEDES
jgi:CheY-like chemotaxis protein